MLIIPPEVHLKTKKMTDISHTQARCKAKSRRNPLWVPRLFNASSRCVCRNRRYFRLFRYTLHNNFQLCAVLCLDCGHHLVLFGSGHSCVDRWGHKIAIKRFPRNRRGKTILGFPFHFVKPATKTQRTARLFWRERGGSGILLSSWVGRFRPFRFVGEWWYNC